MRVQREGRMLPGDRMSLKYAVRLGAALALLMNLSALTLAQSDPEMGEVGRAVTIFNQGDMSGGLALVENVLARSPENLDALFRSAQFNFEMGNADAARGRLERLVKLSGNYFSAWELMTQVAQAQNDLARRDEAIARLKLAISTAIDPEIRDKIDFVRDRIETTRGDIHVLDFFTRGGSDFTRYQFGLGDPRRDPDVGIFLRTDEHTTEDWSNTALLASDKPLFYLVMVDRAPNGATTSTNYQFYVGEPDYDAVRATVMQILRGEVQPLAGNPGGLQGVIKP
jgi:tetratricopeptide (TPR) repeat protein